MRCASTHSISYSADIGETPTYLPNCTLPTQKYTHTYAHSTCTVHTPFVHTAFAFFRWKINTHTRNGLAHTSLTQTLPQATYDHTHTPHSHSHLHARAEELLYFCVLSQPNEEHIHNNTDCITTNEVKMSKRSKEMQSISIWMRIRMSDERIFHTHISIFFRKSNFSLAPSRCFLTQWEINFNDTIVRSTLFTATHSVRWVSSFVCRLLRYTRTNFVALSQYNGRHFSSIVSEGRPNTQVLGGYA